MNPAPPRLDNVLRHMVALSRVVPFFPQDDLAIELIARGVQKFVADDQKLAWLTEAAVDKLTKYDGVQSLRALYCTRYAPADGEAPLVELPGLTEAGLESDFARREMEANEARLAQYKREALLAPAEDRAPLELPLPEVKQVPWVPASNGAVAMSAGAQLQMVEAAIRCPWCEQGLERTPSSVNPLNWIHQNVPYAGRVVCKVRGPLGGEQR